MSVLVDRELNAFHTEGDTCVYVYNTELNSVSNFDFGPERYPTSHLWDQVRGCLEGGWGVYKECGCA